MNYENDIEILINAIKAAGQLPKHIQKTNFKSVFFYNIWNVPYGNIMSYNISTGVDTNEQLALLKSFVEYFERKAFFESNEEGIFPLSKASDGFAAFPKSFPEYFERARNNSLAEAVERFVWGSWWDNKTNAQVSEIYIEDQELPVKDLLSFIDSSHIFMIEPLVENESNIKTIIIFIKLKTGGYISGGASGLRKSDTIFRAASEAVRHYLGFLRYKELRLTPCHFYDERLIYFANGLGNTLVEDRLNSISNKSIILPNLVYDQAVQHSFDNIIYVHRCLFENQPPFVGGDIARLCL